MRRSAGLVSKALLLMLATWVPPGFAADHLVITELAVTPTDGEFVEIFNPTPNVIDLTNYYLSDYVLNSDPTDNYYRLVDRSLLPDPAFPNDFLARFPPGSSIAPGQTIVISIKDNALFSGVWSAPGEILEPDFELAQDGAGDGVPDMIDPGWDIIGSPFIQADAGLSNARECVVLFYWDHVSDLVSDVDIAQWSDSGPDFNTVSPYKTGVSIDSDFDSDNVPTTYLNDTARQGQDLINNGAHDFGATFSRDDFDEGVEILVGGNGITGHDETSEDLSGTWASSTPPSIGSPGQNGPPTILSASAISQERVELIFSRRLDPASAENRTNYLVSLLTSGGGDLGVVPVGVESAILDPNGILVTLKTDPMVSRALYEVRVSGILAEGSTQTVIPGSRVFYRGFNSDREIRLIVPKRVFVPHLDQEMELAYIAPQGEGILLRVFDLGGREVFVMREEETPAGGRRVFRWDGRDHLRQLLPAGAYVLHLAVPATGEVTTAPVVVGAAGKGTLR